jgi:hypothetical protein
MRVRLTAAIAVLLLVVTMIVMVLTHIPAFTIVGDLSTRLRPGVSAPLDVAITNPHSYPLTVTSISVTVTAVTVARTGAPSRCSTTNFTVKQPITIAPITLAPHSRVTLSSLLFAKSRWPQLKMLKTRQLQDVCKNVTVSLAFHASARLWGQS